MAVADSPAAMDDYAYKAIWKGNTIGYLKDFDPSGVKPIVKEKKITAFGDAVIDRRRKGATGSVKTTLHQADLDILKMLCPWWSTGAVAGVPSALAYDELANAGPLVFHPFGVADATKTWDFVFVFAFPNFTLPKADGNWREIAVDWNIYPDPTQLASGLWVTHYYGAPPA